MKLFADVNEFTRGIYDLILSEDYKKFIKDSQFNDNPIFIDGFLRGLTWATILLNGNYGNYWTDGEEIK